MPRVFRKQRRHESLEAFSQRKVSTTESQRKRLDAEMESFVSHLQHQPFASTNSVKEVITNGSLGTDTAVPNLADVELVVVVNGLDNIDELKKARRQLLRDLEDQFKRSLGLEPLDSGKFSLKYRWHNIDITILPAVDVLSRYGSPHNVYDVMGLQRHHVHAVQQFSACLAPLQRDFVNIVPEQVKKVIRLVKLWKMENVLDISNYSLELLTIFVWRSLGSGDPGTDRLFTEVMRKLATCETLRVAFNDHYNSALYTCSTKRPYILDPCNPYMNTLHGASTCRVSSLAENVYRRL